MMNDQTLFRSAKIMSVLGLPRAIMVYYDGLCSATLVLFNSRDANDKIELKLDLAASIRRMDTNIDENGNVICFQYNYIRQEGEIETNETFEVLPIAFDTNENTGDVDTTSANNEINALEFIFSQYSYARFEAAKLGNDRTKDGNDEDATTASAITSRSGEVDTDHEDDEEGGEENSGINESNIVARGFESGGEALRTGMRYAGRGVGHTIRFLGDGYTAAESLIVGPRDIEVKDEDIANVKYHQENCEKFYSGARTLTSSILTPVRELGVLTSSVTQASKDDAKGNDDSQSNSMMTTITTPVTDALYGFGHGCVSVFKGLTDFVTEVGEAVGETAMKHDEKMYGEEYATKITKVKNESAGRVGLGMYKVGNLMSFGVVGLALDAAFEGSVMLLALYEFLVGPVLCQGWIRVSFPPLTRTKYFVVIRPWSIAFYKKPSDFTNKPHRVILTSFLDTIPLMRPYNKKKEDEAELQKILDQNEKYNWHNSLREYDGFLKNTSADSLSMAKMGQHVDDVLKPTAPTTITEKDNVNEREKEGEEVSEQELVDLASKLQKKDAQEEVIEVELNETHMRRETVMVLEDMEMIKAKKREKDLKAIEKEDHYIELCTVDCSVILLYPEAEELQMWFKETSDACHRVESVQKKNKGAGEIMTIRRLALLQKKRRILFKVCKLVVKSFVKTDSKKGASSESLAEYDELPMYESDDEDLDGGDDAFDDDGGGKAKGSDNSLVDLDAAVDQAIANDTAESEVALTTSMKEDGMASSTGIFTSTQDALRNAVLLAAKVRLTPITRGDHMRVSTEEVLTKAAKLKKNKDDSSVLEADWAASDSKAETGETTESTEDSTSITDTASTSNAEADEASGEGDGDNDEESTVPAEDDGWDFEMGNAACLDDKTIANFLLSIKVSTLYRNNAELGRTFISMSKVPCHTEVDKDQKFYIHSKSNPNKIVGYLMARIAYKDV